jgi:hypothetical protein
MENAGIYYGHLEYFTDIWYILWTFGNVVVIWFGLLCQETSGNPASKQNWRGVKMSTAGKPTGKMSTS